MKEFIKKNIIFSLIVLFFICFTSCGKEKEWLVVDGYGYPEMVDLSPSFIQDETKKVKNIILILGDGMGYNQVEVTKMLLEEGKSLDLDLLTDKGEIITSCLDNYVTDSAAAATAYATGVKTIYERAGRDKDGNDLKTILDYAHEAGKKTGVVTDKILKDGTPLAFTAHMDNRYLYPYTIAPQQITSNVDIMMGSGKEYFQDLEEEMEANGYGFAYTKEELMNLESEKIIGAFSNKTMMMEAQIYPTLTEMAYKALNVLSKNEEGFFLLIESGQIDNFCDDGDIEGMARKVVLLDQVLRLSMNFAKENPDTLIIVLADHETGGLVIGEGEPNKSWFTEPTRYHTPVNVPLYAYGMNSSIFNGKTIDNTEVFEYMMKLMGLEK